MISLSETNLWMQEQFEAGHSDVRRSKIQWDSLVAIAHREDVEQYSDFETLTQP